MSSVFYFFWFFCSSGIFFWKQYHDLKVITGLGTAQHYNTSLANTTACAQFSAPNSYNQWNHLFQLQEPNVTSSSHVSRGQRTSFSIPSVNISRVIMESLWYVTACQEFSMNCFTFCFYEQIILQARWLSGSTFLTETHGISLIPGTHVVEEEPIPASCTLTYICTCTYMHAHIINAKKGSLTCLEVE